MKLLLITSEPVSAEQVRSVVGEEEADHVEVMVVAPALQKSALRFWVSDADEAIAQAEQVSRQTVEDLGDAGIAARGDTGESDPLSAIEDALRTFPADRVVVFTRPESDQHYREDVDVAEIEERFGLPAERAQQPSSRR